VGAGGARWGTVEEKSTASCGKRVEPVTRDFWGIRSLTVDLPRFTGSAEHGLDEKGRLVVPARFRERLGPGFVLTLAQPDQCLAMYPLITWNEICVRIEAAPVKDAKYRQFVRHLFAHTEEVACDSQGRLVLPPTLRAFAGIDREVVSIGSLTRVELWAKERLGILTPEPQDAEHFATELGLF
jgi:MraZ protein